MIAVVSVGLPGVATGKSLALLDLQLVNTAPALRDQVDKGLRETFTRFGYRVLPAGEVKRKLVDANAVGCTVGPCLARVARATGARRVLTVGVAAQGSSYDIVLTMLETGGGSVLGQVSRRCDVCTFADVAKSVKAAAAALHSSASRFVESRTWLVVEGTRGARVWLDGVAIGVTPLRRLVTPGRHRVVLRSTAGHTERRQMVLRSGRTVWLLARSRKPLAARPASDDSPHAGPLRWPAWGALGVGGATIAAGAVVLAFDRSCRDDSSPCTDRRELAVPGLALLGAGALTTAAAGLLFWLDRRLARRRAARRSALRIWPGGALFSRSF